MGVGIYYQSLGLLPERKIPQIMQMARGFAKSREWWAEEFGFNQPDLEANRPKNISERFDYWFCYALGVSGVPIDGDTKTFLSGGYTNAKGDWIQVDPLEDQLAAYYDILAIVGFLSQCTRIYRIGWRLECVGETIGAISADGVPDTQLNQFLYDMTQSPSFDPTDIDTMARAALIRKKYASRW